MTPHQRSTGLSIGSYHRFSTKRFRGIFEFQSTVDDVISYSVVVVDFVLLRGQQSGRVTYFFHFRDVFPVIRVLLIIRKGEALSFNDNIHRFYTSNMSFT